MQLVARAAPYFWLLVGAVPACSASAPSTTATPSAGAGAAAGGNLGAQGTAGGASGGASELGSSAGTFTGGSGSSSGGSAGPSGSGLDGQSENGGSVGLPPGGGGSKGLGCAAPGLVFCDDFELGTVLGMAPAAPKWSIARNGNGTVLVDDQVPAHSGSKSVHVSSAGGYQTFLVLSGAPVFPAAQGALYLRLYIRLGAAMTAGHNTYYKAGAADSASSEHETRVGVMNGMLMINQPASDRGFLSNQNYYNDGNMPGVVFPAATWTCVEALFDPPNSTFDIWVNGKEIPDLHRTDWQQDPLGSFRFGFEKYAGPDADLWYDDIAVSARPIGCE